MKSANSNASITSSAAALVIATAASVLFTASIIFSRRHRDVLARLAELEETRAAERKGRIRAEMKLRTQLKNDTTCNELQSSIEGPKDARADDGSILKHNLQLHCIGTVVSPYTKRMGTPRQGALVPSGRGYIQLRIPPECVEGLELYSHAWVLFTFHANTDTPSLKTNSNGEIMNLTKTKIRPPRGDGIKVGMLATRTLVIATAASVLFTASIIFSRRHRDVLARLAELEETRAAERKGRIRAEMKLRTQLKNDTTCNELQSSIEGPKDARADDGSILKHNLQLHCIGTVVSPYTKRMGTPRQGALVPSGRGYIQLRIPPECVEGLELYSHAWVLFTFHANTDTPSLKTNSNGDIMNLTKTKIRRPPEGGWNESWNVGNTKSAQTKQYRLEFVKVDKKKKQLHIAAFDLVNGTPVYDIKPVVPWDVPGHHDKVPLFVPSWVSQDDALQTVKFTPLAKEALEKHVRNGKLSPLYTSKNDGLKGSINSITEVLAQDPRASNTNSPNKRGSKEGAVKNDVYLIVFCNVEIHFRVSADGVLVEDVTELDLANLEHVDGIPILIDR
ncbi:hypothetical protein ACHAWO_010664 [Cyclotella atomus]|uniref:TsaA-like domain-containing protein n=1 Tax=Cyclotella atomus TaxID=382360 RepID=A0ABD3QSD2_9STRA